MCVRVCVLVSAWRTGRSLMSQLAVSQVILDKNPQLKTVVNKVGSIENEYRVFQMECIAGKPEYTTDVVQHGNRFRLNFSEVSMKAAIQG